MILYVGILVATATPLVLGLVALFRGRQEDIPAILRAALRRRGKSRDLPLRRASAD